MQAVGKLEDPFLCTSFVITNLTTGVQKYLNMYELEIWLKSAEADESFTVSNIQYIKPEKLKRCGSRELQKKPREHKMYATAIPSDDAIIAYANKFFERNKAKTAKWLYGENIAEVFDSTIN